MRLLLLFIGLSVVFGVNITKCSDFSGISGNGTYIVLLNNIDCTGVSIGMIGSQNWPFNGTFDGQNYVISNLKINRTTGWVGLFAATSGPARITNLRIVNADVSGDYRVGILIGSMMGGGTVMNVHVQGKVSGTSFSVGGIAGEGYGQIYSSSANVEITVNTDQCYDYYGVGGLIGTTQGTISNSWSNGTISSNGCNVGGLVGYQASQSIYGSYSTAHVFGSGKNNRYTGGLIGLCLSPFRNCYSTGKVEGVNGVGGFAGYAGSRCFIFQSYSLGAVTGETGTGGLVGLIQSSPNITQAYATGLVTGQSPPLGGLIGGLLNQSSTDFINASYWDILTTGQKDSVAGIGKETPEMYKQATYVDWDFQNVWTIKEGESYPYFQPFLEK